MCWCASIRRTRWPCTSTPTKPTPPASRPARRVTSMAFRAKGDALRDAPHAGNMNLNLEAAQANEIELVPPEAFQRQVFWYSVHRCFLPMMQEPALKNGLNHQPPRRGAAPRLCPTVPES